MYLLISFPDSRSFPHNIALVIELVACCCACQSSPCYQHCPMLVLQLQPWPKSRLSFILVFLDFQSVELLYPACGSPPMASPSGHLSQCWPCACSPQWSLLNSSSDLAGSNRLGLFSGCSCFEASLYNSSCNGRLILKVRWFIGLNSPDSQSHDLGEDDEQAERNFSWRAVPPGSKAVPCMW